MVDGAELVRGGGILGALEGIGWGFGDGLLCDRFLT